MPLRKRISSKAMKGSATWTQAACMLMAAACLVGAASARRVSRFGPIRPVKQVWTAAPGNLTKSITSCAWDGQECDATVAPIFAKRAPIISPENYPARATAYNAAADLFCSQFSENQCSWPCQFNTGVGCQVNGDSYYQVFNCPGSLVYNERACSSPSLQSGPACLSQPGCSYTSTPVEPDAVCTSTYAASLTPDQQFNIFVGLQFGMMPRQLMGCCKGSVYKYQLANWCNAAFNNETGLTNPAACAKVPGCIWDTTTANFCVPSPQTEVALQFAYKPSDPLATTLSTLSGECRAIKDAKTCNSYKPVEVDPSKVKVYMAINERLNAPITEKQCPLPSATLPNL